MRPNNKCRMARPLTLPNFVALGQKSVPDIRFLKFLISLGRELETGSKVHQNSLRPATDKSPSACQISSLSAKRCTRNVIQVFYLLVNFGAPCRGPIGSSDVQQGPIYQNTKFRPVLTTCVRDISCQTTLLSLTAWPTNMYSKQFSAYHAATINSY